MANIRSINEIISALIDYFKIAQPDLDTKPATVERDVFIDAPASQLSLVYEELSRISNIQSIRSANGADLDKIGANYGITRKSGAQASGIAILTFSSIPASVAISAGSNVFSNNNVSFSVASSLSVLPSQTNYYKSIATKYRSDLDFVGISDQYAVEVTVQSTVSGSSGNIAKYALNSTTIAGVSNVTNVSQFSGGSDQESDASYRNRILSIFSGSNIGTAVGYKNVALSDASVLDAVVIQPGDVLMTRDGTIVETSSTGAKTIVSEGTGGKVDVVILGTRTADNIDTFIYRDKSNTGDATNSKNDIVLGQIDGDQNKTITRKRIDEINNAQLPAQPVDSVSQVSGTSSGSNFIPKSTDSLGRVSGNYEIIPDTSSYSGSPFGFDKFHWISNQISDFDEDKVKGQFNGQDQLNFSDFIASNKLTQNILITNENSTIYSSDRSIIILAHTPITNVTRVFNVTTGETYTVVSQNPDGSGSINETGRIKVSGNNLPALSDTLQVDYEWIFSYDPYVDYDGKLNDYNLRTPGDNIDWGMSNLVKGELVKFTRNLSNTYFNGTSTHPVSAIVSSNVFSEIDGVVELNLTDFAGRKVVTITDLPEEFTSLEYAYLKNTFKECYHTNDNDGIFSSSRVVINSSIRYQATIVLPSDTIAKEGDTITFIYNTTDIFTVNSSTGNFLLNQITIPVANYTTTSNSFYCYVNYIANVQQLFSTLITGLSASRLGNGFINNTAKTQDFNIESVLKSENATIQASGLNFTVTLTANSQTTYLDGYSIFKVIRLSDNLDLWNSNNLGTVSTDISGYYYLTLSGLNAPATNEKVLVLYYANDVAQFQPFTFANKIFFNYKTQVQYNSIDGYYLDLFSFTDEAAVSFNLFNSNDDSLAGSATDGVITGLTNQSCYLYSASLNFSSIANLLGKKVNIVSGSNEGIYDVIAYDLVSNKITLNVSFENINSSQIASIRISDGQEIWSSDGVIDLENDKLLLPNINFTTNIPLSETLVIFYTSKQLKAGLTNLNTTLTDQTNQNGILTFAGTTITKGIDIVFNATQNSLRQSLSEAIRNVLGLSSITEIPSTVSLVRLVKLEKVEATSANEVLSVYATYDVKNYSIANDTFYKTEINKLDDVSPPLSNFDVILPSSTNNIDYIPSVGDKLRATFYICKSGDTESLSFTKNSTLYTNKKFALIDSIYVSSGFNNTSSARFNIVNANQPNTGSRYKAYYDYTAPKTNERIIIRYTYNKLISDVTFNVEENKPINADVLVRSAVPIKVDATVNIVVNADQLSSSSLVAQNVKDALISAINTNILGDILDSSTLIVVAQETTGVDRARLLYFNQDMKSGQALSLEANKNEYFVANDIVVNLETR